MSGAAGRRVPHLRRRQVTVNTPPPVTIRVPSGLNATLLTALVCPVSSSSGVPVRASHTFAVWSRLPVTIRVPSGLNATLFTAPVCPFSSSSGVPVRASHTFAVCGWFLSPPPVTIRVPSGLNATLSHQPVCP